MSPCVCPLFYSAPSRCQLLQLQLGCGFCRRLRTQQASTSADGEFEPSEVSAIRVARSLYYTSRDGRAAGVVLASDVAAAAAAAATAGSPCSGKLSPVVTSRPSRGATKLPVHDSGRRVLSFRAFMLCIRIFLILVSFSAAFTVTSHKIIYWRRCNHRSQSARN